MIRSLLGFGTALIRGNGTSALASIGQRRYLKRPAINQTQLKEKRRTGCIALKVGMMGIWDKWGQRHAVTILHIDDCRVLQIKTEETNGYTALQVGAGEAKVRRVNVPDMGRFKAAGVTPKREVSEFRVTPDAILPVGTEIRALHFVAGQLLDIQGVTKGKGFQGGMKRHHFSGLAATHGVSVSHRSIGATGQRQDPGRVFKGKKMPGRMGNATRTGQNLKLLRIDPVKNLLYVKGCVAGNAGTFCRVTDATKGPFWPSPPPFPTAFGAQYDNLKDIIDAPVPEKDPFVSKIPEDCF